MSAENRLYFEKNLLRELKIVASKFDGAVASKNKLKFKHDKKYVGELFFDHLARVDSYVLGGIVNGGEIFDCISNFAPPYNSNLFSDACFSFVSSGEQNKWFSGDFGGAIKTPNPDFADEVCAHVQLVLEDFYVPKVLACIVPAERTVGDVLSALDECSYPAVFIHCAAQIYGVAGSSAKVKEAMS
ncbi:hypothetical protein GLGCALEP_01916 [Pseudomonas sp. MM221]|nr:hypothetical protein GLGCALEP_01916 [Pseudomonas sp. MM221]